MGLFAVGMVTVSYREKGKFRRLAVTPLPKWVFIMGQILQRVTVVALQTTLLLVVARLGFQISNQGSYLVFGLLVFAGTGDLPRDGIRALELRLDGRDLRRDLEPGLLPDDAALRRLLPARQRAEVDAERGLHPAALAVPARAALGVQRRRDARRARHRAGDPRRWAVLCFALAVKRFRWV
jgi:hypothetical protein